jgi:Zn-dependent protease
VNLLLAIGSVLVFVLVGLLGRVSPGAETTLAIIQAMMFDALRLNLVLLAFNLIPIPPLDGSHVMKYLLPPSWSLRYQQLGRYGIVILPVGRSVLAAFVEPMAQLSGAI